MSQSNPAPSYDDEISISELLMKLWAKRGLIVMLPLVLVGLTIVCQLITKSGSERPTTVHYFIELNGIRLEPLTPEINGTSNGRSLAGNFLGSSLVAIYPNGSKFSPQDLVHASVLKTIADDLDLDTQRLAQSIDVQFGTPLSNGLLAEYRAALAANSALSGKSETYVSDLSAINQSYGEKIATTSKRGLKISVNFDKLDITEEVGIYVAEALPRVWNQIYTEQVNTTMPTDIPGLRWTREPEITNTVVGLQLADMRLREVEKGAGMLVENGRLESMRLESGLSASEVLSSIGDFRRIFFEPVFYAAFEEESSLSIMYEQDYRLQIEGLSIEIAEIDARIFDLRNYQSRNDASSAQNSGNQTAQLDGSALTAIVNLAEQATLSTYLQESLDQRYDLVKKKSDLTTRLARIQPREKQNRIDSVFQEQVFDRYSEVMKGYRELVLMSQASLKTQNQSYYSVVTQPERGRETELFSKRDILFISLALAIGATLAIIAALVWPQRPRG